MSHEGTSPVAHDPRPAPGWADARLWPPTGEPIGDPEDMIDDDDPVHPNDDDGG